MYRMYSTIPVESLKIVTNRSLIVTITTVRFTSCNKGNENTAKHPNRYEELLQERDLEEFQDNMWNNRWLKTEKDQWTHEIYPDFHSRKKTDDDPTLEIVHFLTEHSLRSWRK